MGLWWCAWKYISAVVVFLAAFDKIFFSLFSAFLLSYSTIDTSRQPSLHISTISIRFSSQFFCFSFEKQTKISFKKLYFPSCSRLIFGGRVGSSPLAADRLRTLSVEVFSCHFQQFFSCPLSRQQKRKFYASSWFFHWKVGSSSTTTHSGRMKTWLRPMRNVCVGFIYKTNDNENPV